jgi:uncharacterized repeat protein (TIGR01451 family)
MTYTVIAPADGVITNTVTAAANAIDPAPANNTAPTTVTVTPLANLQVSKTAASASVPAGQPMTYTVVVQNLGPSTATGVVITDVFRGGATFGSVIATSGGATLQASSTNEVAFTASVLGAGGMMVMTYTVIAPADGVITNTVTAAASEADPVLANNTASTTVTVTPLANWQVPMCASALANLPPTYAAAPRFTHRREHI